MRVRLAFGVWRLAFGVWRLAFGVRRLAFGVRRSEAVPQGPNEGSQAVYGLGWYTKEIRPVGNGMNGYAWRYHIQRPPSASTRY
jgi:hypothetical protein